MPQHFTLWVCPKLQSSSPHYTGTFSPKLARGSGSPQAGPSQAGAKPVLSSVSQLPAHLALSGDSVPSVCHVTLIHLARHLKAALIINVIAGLFDEV